MKAVSILENKGVKRDEHGLPAFANLSEIRAAFKDDEITIMVNHYLMSRKDWARTGGEGSTFTGQLGSWKPKPKKLKANVPLKAQLSEKKFAEAGQ